jgi:hypothetical protein
LDSLQVSGDFDQQMTSSACANEELIGAAKKLPSTKQNPVTASSSPAASCSVDFV